MSRYLKGLGQIFDNKVQIYGLLCSLISQGVFRQAPLLYEVAPTYFEDNLIMTTYWRF